MDQGNLVIPLLVHKYRIIHH